MSLKRNSRNINKSTRRERSRPFPTHALTPPDIAQAITSIKRSKNIVIAGHLNPDGDSLGSMLALGLALGGAGKHVYMISPNGVPARYRYLPGADKIRRGLNGRGNPDLAIAVDCSNKEILGGSFSIFRRSRYILEIDHHDYRRPFGDISVIDTKASAVGELVYILLKELGSSITRDVAENLLTSIVVETSSFRLPNVRPFTFEICSSLMKTGVDFYRLIDTIYWSRNRKSAVLSGICLSRCRFISNNRIAWSIIRKSDFDSVGGKDEDVDAVAEEIRAIKGVKMVILFRERGHGRLRVSLRSKGAINIGGLAEEFGGGGHFDIAGCAIPNTKRAIELFLDRAKYFLKVPRYDG